MKKILLLVGLMSSLGVNAAPVAKGFYASVVSKREMNYKSFIDRMVSQKYHLVLSEQKINSNSLYLEDHTDDNKDFYFVEVVKSSPAEAAQIFGIVKRAERLVLAYATESEMLAVHLAYPKYHIEKVDLFKNYFTSTTVPKALSSYYQLNTGSFHSIDTPSEQWIVNKLEELSGRTPVTVGSETFTISERYSPRGRLNARKYLASEYAELGYEVSEHNYGRGVNLVASRSGTASSDYIIVSAHYDSYRNAGADDDGSGVIGTLAVAKSLAAINPAIGIRFVSFDEEEVGLVGSKAYAKMLNDSGELQNLLGVVNLEMLAYDENSDGKFHSIHCNENTSKSLHHKLMAEISSRSIDLEYVNACTNRSDHAAFWKYSKPAIVISQNFFGWPADSNPCYHKACDQVDQLNFGYMKRLVDAIAPTVLSIVSPGID